MSEEQNKKEQTPPTKEEILKFLQDQIDVKKVQLELQVLNERLAVSKAEELKALSIIGNITNPQQQVPHGTPHKVTQEDLDNNPDMVEAGIKLGDEIFIGDGPAPSNTAEVKERKLKN